MSGTHLSFDFNGESLPVFVGHDNQVWIHAATICKVLELTNPSKTLERRVPLIYRRVIPVGVGMPAWYVLEPGFYQLVFRSKAEKALEFQRWVFEKVLPSIRKQGCYISPDATVTQLEALQQQISNQLASLESGKIAMGN